MQNDSSSKTYAAHIAESAFDALYLTASLSLAAGLLATGRALWGAATTILFVGDALHLIPRIYRFATGRTSAAERAGKTAASVTMTLFYALLWWRAASLYGFDAVSATAVIALSSVRVALCLVPRSFSADEPSFLPLLRNLPFVALGAVTATQYGMLATATPAALAVALAIAASFAFYLPVAAFAKRKPKIGMLMIPKSCAYLAIAALGFAF